jgi:hypothetical protein
MRRFSGYIILAAALMSFCSSSVHADDPSLTIGIKVRHNSATVDVSNNFVIFDDAKDSQLLAGPSLKFSYGKFFCGVTWLQTLDRYTFEFNSFTANDEGHTDISMSDLDALAGYMVHPRIGFILGYKSLTSRATPHFDHRFDLSVKGPAIGVTSNYPIKYSPFTMVANISYMPFLKYDFLEPPQGSQQDAAGYSVEIGFTYGESENSAFSLGIKRQALESELDDSWKSLALTFSFDYRF